MSNEVIAVMIGLCAAFASGAMVFTGAYAAEQAMARSICGEADAIVRDGAPWCLGPNGYERVLW